MNITLKDLQQNFKNHLFSLDSAIADHIVSDKLPADFRLAIYANGYVARLVETLEGDYPVLSTLLDEASFFPLCQSYIAKHPSTYTSLRWFGRHLPGYLREHEPYKDEPYLAELAEFEWALVDAFNASDKASIAENDMAQVPVEKWPEVSFTFHPAVRTCQYQWNIIPIWQAHKDQRPLPKPQKLPKSETCLIWRQDLKTLFRTLPTDEAIAITAARDGANFSQLCEQLSAHAQDPEQIPFRAASLLKTWIAGAMVSGISY